MRPKFLSAMLHAPPLRTACGGLLVTVLRDVFSLLACFFVWRKTASFFLLKRTSRTVRAEAPTETSLCVWCVLKVKKPAASGLLKWSHGDLNTGPLACEASALAG